VSEVPAPEGGPSADVMSMVDGEKG
jgi:hypothetical protein